MPHNTPDNAQKWVTLAVIVGAHGTDGALRVKCFGDNPQGLQQCGVLTDGDHKNQFEVTMVQGNKDAVRIKLKGIATRQAAQALKGTMLCAARHNLPSLDKEDAFYHADLIGLCVRTADGQSLGEIIGVHNFGAGDLLEITRYGERQFVPFTKAHVPEIDMESGYVVVVLADEKEPDEKEPDEMRHVK